MGTERLGGNMNIPNKFKETIQNIFYDKKLSIYSTENTLDDEGSVIEGEKQLVEEIDCNIQIQTVEKIRQDYGADITAEAIVTCENTKAKIGNITSYNGIEYEIIRIIPSDSHITMLLHHIQDGKIENGEINEQD